MAKEAPGKQKRPTAQKRDIQSEKRRLINKAFKSRVKTALRHFDESLPKNDENLSKQTLSDVFSLMDKGVKRGVFKINKASRVKARCAARLAARS